MIEILVAAALLHPQTVQVRVTPIIYGQINLVMSGVVQINVMESCSRVEILDAQGNIISLTMGCVN